MHKSCIRKIEKENNRQAAHNNKGKREFKLEVGQQVWKWNTKLSSKAEGYSAKLGLPRVGAYSIDTGSSKNPGTKGYLEQLKCLYKCEVLGIYNFFLDLKGQNEVKFIF